MNCTVWRGLAIVISVAVQIGLAQMQEPRKADGGGMSTEQVLERWAEALGGREALQRVATLHVRGSIETGGMKGTYERWATSSGDLRRVVDLSGAYHQVNVFDGKDAWMMDNSGAVHEIAGDALKTLVSSAYEASESFLFADRMPGSVELVSDASNQDTVVLRLEPRDGMPMTVYLDAKSFLPQREETSDSMGKRVVTFSGWRDFGGLKFPGNVLQSNGNSKFDAVITTEQVEINPTMAAELFEKPSAAAQPIQFEGGKHEAVFPATVYGDHIFLPVRVNGSGEAWFFFDTGASMSLVSDGWARKAGLTVEGTLGAKGSGAGTASMGLAKNVVMEVPGARVPLASVAVWDLAPLQAVMGRQWDGAFGYDVISRVVARVDYERQQITLYDPSSFVPDPEAAMLPVTFSSGLGNMPTVRARIVLPGRGPVDVQCAVDSGANGFHLTAPFAKANRVLESVKKTIASDTIGAGGESKEFAGRIEGLQLGPYLVREPIVTFSPDAKEGLLASQDIGALIGGKILQRFTVTFDFPHRRMLLEPNSHFSDAFRDNETGLSLLAKGADFRTFEVDQVEHNSPAEAAGLRKGDVLTAVDGHAARALDLRQIDQLLEQRGHTVPITILRDGRTRKLRLKLMERI